MKRMAIAILVGLALFSTVNRPANADTPEGITARAAALLPWVARHTGYKAEYVKVRFAIRSQEQLQHIFYGRYYRDGLARIGAITIDNVVFLPEAVSDSTLVHELTHVLQNANGHVVGKKPGDFACIGKVEEEAYQTEDAWKVETKSTDPPTDPFFFFFVTQCASYGPYTPF